MKKYAIILTIFIAILSSEYFFAGQINKEPQIKEEKQKQQTVAKNIPVQVQGNPETEENKQAEQPQKIKISEKIKLKVPFVLQAPFANWKDKNFQNGCEEAAMIMAIGWINKISAISAKDSKKQIEDIIAFENKELGYSSDTDIFDIKKVFKEYFKYEKVETREDIKIDDIKEELQKGNLVLVPAFGRALGNPNYTYPGPITHMLVIIGYDPETEKFITNDSGTRKGKDYEYAEKVLFDAIWEYPSGKIHPDPPEEILKKGMIVVKS